MPEVRVDPTFPVQRMLGAEFARVGGRPLLLDAVFAPGRLHGEPEGPRPAVLFVGEPWIKGVRSTDPWYHPYLATHGFVAASCDVRAFAEAPFPAQLHDVKAAIRWLRAHAATYGINPQRIGIWGDSIAAYLAALTGVTGDSGHPELEGPLAPGAPSSRVQAVVWASGVSDIPRLWAAWHWTRVHLSRLLGVPADAHPDLARLASPVTHVGPDAPPFLLLHGTRDETTAFEQAVLLHQALRAAGVESELVPLLGRYHNWTGVEENTDERWRYWDLAPMALPFFIRHLRPWHQEARTHQALP
jgi:acetyl esterase/lipase